MIIDKHEIIVDSKSCGERIDTAISINLSKYSRSLVKKMIVSNNVKLNGQIIKPDKRVKIGDLIKITIMLEPESDLIKPQEIGLNFVEVNDNFLVLNKRAGLVMHPAPGNMDHTVVNGLISRFPELKLLPRAGLIHRIDKDTTGLVLVARNLVSYHKLIKKLSMKAIKREYLALVNGIIISGGKINRPIGRHHLHRKKMTIREDGKNAVTHYRVREKFRNHTFLDVVLETGRTHQIRVHMASIGHPLVGDKVYGWKPIFGKKSTQRFQKILSVFKRQALHAHKLTFVDFDNEKKYEFQCELPHDFKKLLKELNTDNIFNNDNYSSH